MLVGQFHSSDGLASLEDLYFVKKDKLELHNILEPQENFNYDYYDCAHCDS